ncbi:hypothetical protein AAIH32_21330 [Pseudarthrobacter oxydans]|uniref:hypothetical protein n=1 Tax=Pseudarthrobacter oxydans TaxID=1671 RepID=UPI003D2D5BC7
MTSDCTSPVIALRAVALSGAARTVETVISASPLPTAVSNRAGFALTVVAILAGGLGV